MKLWTPAGRAKPFIEWLVLQGIEQTAEGWYEILLAQSYELIMPGAEVKWHCVSPQMALGGEFILIFGAGERPGKK